MGPANEVKHVVVAGGAGYIGSVLSRQLLEAGYRVTVFDSLLFGEESVQELKASSDFTLVQGDLRHLEEVSAVLQDQVDAVVLLGALVGENACDRDPRETVDTNLLGAKTLAEACRYYNIPRFIFASTDSAYGIQEGIMYEDSPLRPISLYARLKMAVEQEILALKNDTFHPTVLRMATIYGFSPRMRFDLVINVLTLRAWTDNRITVYGGEQWRPLVHVEDAARAYLLCLQADLEKVDGQVFNVGSNQQNYQVGKLGEMVGEVFEGVEIETIPQTPDLRDYHVNFDKIGQVMGYQVGYSVKDGIEGIRQGLEEGLIGDYNDRRYYNA